MAQIPKFMVPTIGSDIANIGQQAGQMVMNIGGAIHQEKEEIKRRKMIEDAAALANQDFNRAKSDVKAVRELYKEEAKRLGMTDQEINLNLKRLREPMNSDDMVKYIETMHENFQDLKKDLFIRAEKQEKEQAQQEAQQEASEFMRTRLEGVPEHAPLPGVPSAGIEGVPGVPAVPKARFQEEVTGGEGFGKLSPDVQQAVSESQQLKSLPTREQVQKREDVAFSQKMREKEFKSKEFKSLDEWRKRARGGRGVGKSAMDELDKRFLKLDSKSTQWLGKINNIEKEIKSLQLLKSKLGKTADELTMDDVAMAKMLDVTMEELLSGSQETKLVIDKGILNASRMLIDAKKKQKVYENMIVKLTEKGSQEKPLAEMYLEAGIDPDEGIEEPEPIKKPKPLLESFYR